MATRTKADPARIPGTAVRHAPARLSPKAKPVYSSSAYVRTRNRSVTVISVAVASRTQPAAIATPADTRGKVTWAKACHVEPANNASSSSSGSTATAAAPTNNTTHGTAAMACTQIAPCQPDSHGAADGPRAREYQPNCPHPASQAAACRYRGMSNRPADEGQRQSPAGHVGPQEQEGQSRSQRQADRARAGGQQQRIAQQQQLSRIIAQQHRRRGQAGDGEGQQ